MKKSKQKPKFFLLSGKEAFNPESLAKLYQQLTGKSATPQEIEECRQRLLAVKGLPDEK